MADRCSFCGSTAGPFSKVEGLFTVLMCADCLAARGHGPGPYPVMTRAQMRAGLDLLPTWGPGAEGSCQPPAHRRHASAPGRGRGGGSHVPGAGAGLAGAPSRGHGGPGRRAPGSAPRRCCGAPTASAVWTQASPSR